MLRRRAVVDCKDLELTVPREHDALAHSALTPTHHVAAAMKMDEEPVAVLGSDHRRCQQVGCDPVDDNLLVRHPELVEKGLRISTRFGSGGLHRSPFLERRRRRIPGVGYRPGEQLLELRADGVGHRHLAGRYLS